MQAGAFPYPNCWLSLLICVFALYISGHSAHAQDLSAEITKHQERYVNLQKEITTSQARILSSANTYGAQEVAYGQLDYVGDMLSSMNREFDVLSITMGLASMVTDKRLVPFSRQYIDVQRSYMTKQTSISVKSIEKIMPRVTDQETIRLLLEARDILRSSSDFLDRLKSVEAQRK